MSSLPLTQHPTAAPPKEARPSFFYDLGDAESWLAAERVNGALPVVPEWVPVDARRLGGAADDPLDRDAIERVARERGLQPLRWPATWPPASREALIAATYAKQTGRAVAFSLAAFRQALAGGRDLGDRDTVLLAGAAAELHPRALTQALERGAVAAALDDATAAAAAAGVRRVPAVRVDAEVFHGDAGVDRAARVLAGGRGGAGGGAQRADGGTDGSVA
ncbi:DsbA family protein [Conexibacter arvalis]|uniref:2-hydroxychromene-2-carboxylate isomerase n=1 Tax=Conexibacter arvalis TaxID=912552 RepID=A0A840IL11_9ACTN|nr:DsbA family protein [Conexibacter arvalis]MBB4665015.1 2-hydroxychromene-2-carboxylate isomerase [Conexibacter arvalis]